MRGKVAKYFSPPYKGKYKQDWFNEENFVMDLLASLRKPL